SAFRPFLVPQRRRGAKFFLFYSVFVPESMFLSLNFFLETGPIAPIEAEILLCRGSAQKIVAHSGNSSSLKNKFQIMKIQTLWALASLSPKRTYNLLSELYG
ncbi:hypothetical protein RB619_13005, partial [Flavobacterium sp. LHD-80]|uniref:hypothetical protein n=1 Tax=Flavobacterium sp. LHD-80 TaxID=3071411 RepID=UPI0027E0E9FC